MISNFTAFDIPPLPQYTLHPLPPLLPWISDAHLALALPVIAYWVVSLFFHIIDSLDLFPQYRLHTPIELLKKNHATRWDVFRDVVMQQIIQTLFGLLLVLFDPEPTFGKEDYDVAVWAQRIRIGQRAIPFAFALLGVDSTKLGLRLGGPRSMIAGALSGGKYPQLHQILDFQDETIVAPAFASWEILAAKSIYWFIIPAIQFSLAIIILDSWQYFLHRAMHVNHWLYTKFHSRHHRLYVPYAYGALYNHPVEGFALDTLGGGLAYLLTGLTVRQTMWFFTCSTIKTVDDHCGYALPWDPLQHITANNAAYHDIHHQSWGIKSNFSQPFLTIWDSMLGTMWRGGDVKIRYEKARKAADEWWELQKRKAEEKSEGVNKTEVSGHALDNAAIDDDHVPLISPSARAQEQQQSGFLRRSPRKQKQSSISAPSPLKGLRNRMAGNLPNGVHRVHSTN